MIDAHGRIRDLSAIIADVSGSALLPDSLTYLRQLDAAALPLLSEPPRLGPCIGSVSKFLCIDLNCAAHAAESGVTVPPEPVVFMKARSCICGACDDVELPLGSQKADWEVELGVVIGRQAKARRGKSTRLRT